MSEWTRYGVWEMDARRSTDRMCRSHTARTLRARFIPGVRSSVGGRGIGRNVRQSGSKTGVSSVSAITGCRRPVAFPSRAAKSAKLRCRTIEMRREYSCERFQSSSRSYIFQQFYTVQRRESSTVFSGASFTSWSGVGEGWGGGGQLRRRYQGYRRDHS